MKRAYVIPLLALTTLSFVSFSSCSSNKNTVVSIDAVAKKTNFKLDESIKKEDVTVTLIYKDNTKEETTDFTFETSKDYYYFQISDIGEAEVKIYAKGKNTTVKVNVTAEPTYDKIRFVDFSETEPYTCSVEKLKDNISGNVVIPETYTSSTDHNTYTITKIAENGFYGCSKVSGFYLPKTIKVIDEFGFANCEHLYSGSPSINLEDCIQLENIRQRAFSAFGSIPKMPDSVKYIGTFGFWSNNDRLEKLPSSLISIGDGAFCFNSLGSVTIPEKVTAIGDSAFDLAGVTEVAVDSPTIANSKKNIGDLYGSASTVKIKNTITLDANTYVNLRFEQSGSEGSYRTYTERYFGYEITDTTNKYCSIFAGTCTGVVTIPTSVILGGDTYTITAIGYDGFHKGNVKEVHIPSTIKKIYASFFFDLSLEKAYFENPVGWSAGSTTINQHDLENPTLAAEYLRRTYGNNTWTQA